MRSSRIVALLLVTLVAPAMPAAADTTGPGVQVNADAEDVYTRFAPDLAIDPADDDHLVVVDLKRVGVAQDTRAAASCQAHVSFDGGATWAVSELPVPDGLRCTRRLLPKVAFGGGRVYAAYFAIGSSTHVPSTSAVPVDTPLGPVSVAGTSSTPVGSIVVARSENGGLTWDDPVTPPPSAFEAPAQALGEDPRVGLVFMRTPRLNYMNLSFDAIPADVAIETDVTGDTVWVAWSAGRPRAVLSVARSTDGAATFGQPVPVPLPLAELANHANYRGIHSVSLAHAGEKLYAAYMWRSTFDYYDSMYEGGWGFKLVFSESDDGGRTFAPSRSIATVAGYEVHGGLPRSPALAVDPDRPERVYVAYEDQFEGDLSKNVYVLRSINGGRTWLPQTRMGSDPFETGLPHERPALSVAPGGRVDVAWYDGRHDPSSPTTSCIPGDPVCSGRDVYYTYSVDGGTTWSPEVRVTPATFEAKARRVGEGQERGEVLGAIGIGSTASGVTLVWEQSGSTVHVPGDRPANVTIWDLMLSRVHL